jgi:hypothetical protein
MSSFLKEAQTISPFDVSCITTFDVNNNKENIMCKTKKLEYKKCLESDIADFEALTEYKLNPSLVPYAGIYWNIPCTTYNEKIWNCARLFC